MRKNSFSLLFGLILMFTILSCKKENNKIANSTYTIDSIEVFLDTIKQLSLIPGDLSVFDSIKQMGDTTAYYLFSNYYVDGNVTIDQVGGTAQKPRFLVKDNKLIGIDYYVPSGLYGQDGNGYKRTKYFYNTSNRMDSFNFGEFYFKNFYDENIFFSAERNPDSLSNGWSDAELKSTGSGIFNYNYNNITSVDFIFNSYPTEKINKKMSYNILNNQNLLIGIDVNQLILNSFFAYGIISGYGGTNGNYAYQLMLVNINTSFNIPTDKLISSVDTSTINYDFDALNNNRIRTIEFPSYITNQKLKYIFHYKN